jgi:hypothetical protein
MGTPVRDSSPDLRGGTPFVPLPGPRASIPQVTHFRSTWVVSSLEGIRARGHFERYQAFLGRHRDEILSCIAGVWLPIDVAKEHYQACEQLGISDDEYGAMAMEGSQVRTSWNARIVAETSAPEATPWTAFTFLHRAWSRACDGGAVGAFRLAENRARLECLNCGLFEIPYFRRAVGFMIDLMASRSCKNFKVRQLEQPDNASCFYLAEWR